MVCIDKEDNMRFEKELDNLKESTKKPSRTKQNTGCLL